MNDLYATISGQEPGDPDEPPAEAQASAEDEPVVADSDALREQFGGSTQPTIKVAISKRIEEEQKQSADLLARISQPLGHDGNGAGDPAGAQAPAVKAEVKQ